MATQPSVKQFFKTRKRPVSILKKEQELSERPAKVFVTEEKLGLEDVKSLNSKIVYNISSLSTNDEVTQINKSNDPFLDEKIASCKVSKETNEEFLKEKIPARPTTPENFISVEPPLTPSTIRSAEPTTPSHKNVLPERPSTPESNVETLEAIQKVS